MSTSREMKKAFRKHSLDFKKENCSHKAENYRVELPPLLLKKGVSLPV